jgi:hypothetical protein
MKNWIYKSTVALTFTTLFTGIASAAPLSTNPDTAKAKVVNSGGSGSGSISAAVPSDGSALPEGLRSTLSTTAAATDCTYWWVNGNHKWSWKSYYLYMSAKLSADTSTTYGTSTASCGTPLVVDRLEMFGETFSTSGNSPKVRINHSQNNVSSISKSDTVEVYGIGLTAHPCGAKMFHRATKNGVVWSTVSKSGCGGDPGTY